MYIHVYSHTQHTPLRSFVTCQLVSTLSTRSCSCSDDDLYSGVETSCQVINDRKGVRCMWRGYPEFFLGDKAAGTWCWPRQPSAKVTGVVGKAYVSTPPPPMHVFTNWCLTAYSEKYHCLYKSVTWMFKHFSSWLNSAKCKNNCLLCSLQQTALCRRPSRSIKRRTLYGKTTSVRLPIWLSVSWYRRLPSLSDVHEIR